MLNAWNNALAEKFLEYFVETYKLGDMNKKEATSIRSRFEARLFILRGEWRSLIEEKPKNRDIWVKNLKGRENREIDLGWEAMLNMVDTLAMGGMSSDEGDVDQENRAIYIVKKELWQSELVTSRLQFIDSRRNTTNAFGGVRLGNAPRKRMRVQGAGTSARSPVVNCPTNYYTLEFVANLDNRAYNELDIQEEHDLGHILSRE